MAKLGCLVPLYTGDLFLEHPAWPPSATPEGHRSYLTALHRSLRHSRAPCDSVTESHTRLFSSRQAIVQRTVPLKQQLLSYTCSDMTGRVVAPIWHTAVVLTVCKAGSRE